MPQIDEPPPISEEQQLDHVERLHEQHPDVRGFIAAVRAEQSGLSPVDQRVWLAKVTDVGLGSTDPEARRSAVDYLVEHLERGSEIELLERVLLRFRRADFSLDAHARIERLVKQRVTAGRARIAGIAEVEGAVEPLADAAAAGFAPRTPALSIDPAWNAALALARMGNEKWQAEIEARVRHEDDIVLRATRLFRDLGYTKTQGSFDLLASYLDSPARLPTVKPTQAQGEREAAHAARVIVMHVEGAPTLKGLDDDAVVAAVQAWARPLEQWPIWR